MTVARAATHGDSREVHTPVLGFKAALPCAEEEPPAPLLLADESTASASEATDWLCLLSSAFSFLRSAWRSINNTRRAFEHVRTTMLDASGRTYRLLQESTVGVPIQLVPRSPRRSRKDCRAVRQLILSSRALFLHATPCRQACNSGNLALAAPLQDGPLPPSESKIRLFQTFTVDFTYGVGHMITVPGDKLIVQQGQGCSSRESYSGRRQRHSGHAA